MKLWAVAMVRNEADILEAFVRHNLAFLDGMALLDHASTDGTYEMIAALQAEGLPIVRLRTLEPALFKGSHITNLARECFARTGADFVFALDADEFIHAPSREAVEEALDALPPATHALLSWRSYVPTSFAGFGAHSLHLRLREEAIVRWKVVIHRVFAGRPGDMVSEGNHAIFDVEKNERTAHREIAPEVLSLAHCPVRSAAQLASKAKLGYQARLAAGKGQVNPMMSYHWRQISEDLERGVELDDARMRLIAMNYTVPREQWAAQPRELVEDPLRLRSVRGNKNRRL